MRSSQLARRAAMTAAVLLSSACGGGGEEEDAASSSTAASSSAAPDSAAETSSEAPEAGSEFCTQAEDFGTRISSSFDSADPTQLSQNLQEAADGFREIEPPDELAEDWSALADGLEQVSTTLDGADVNDPEVAAQVQADLQSLQTPATNVQTYLQEQCGIDTGVSESPSTAGSEAAPSS